MQKILIIEDISSLRDVLKSVLETEGFHVETAPTGEVAHAYLQSRHFDCVLSDFRLPGQSGIEVLKELRALDTKVPFVLMTAYGSIEIAVEAMKYGATDFITKPFEPENLCSLLRQVIEHHRIIDREGAGMRRPRRFLSQSPKVHAVLNQARKVACVDSTALILGESGTGKELLARFVHEHSPRADKPFVAINCAAMPESLLESEFFGHEAGAFTGATQARQGLFEYASEGTIFLDEVGDMPLNLQVKLLRALQEREIKRVGGNKSIAVNPRIIAATNKDIEQALAQGELREDFYYRLAVITLTLPPLKERKEDIELLANSFVDYFSVSTNRHFTLSEGALAVVKSHSWPGNARELENIIERATILSEGEIRPEHLGLGPAPLDLQALGDATLSLTEVAQRAARKAEIELITRTLGKTGWNKSKASEILGVSYKTLLNKVRDYALERPSCDTTNQASVPSAE